MVILLEEIKNISMHVEKLQAAKAFVSTRKAYIKHSLTNIRIYSYAYNLSLFKHESISSSFINDLFVK